MEQWQYEHFVSQIHRTAYKRYENFVLGALIHDKVIQDLLITTQHYVRLKNEGYALVDIYFPQLKIAVEVDEPHHENSQAADQEREKQIQDALACDVVRISIASGNVPSQVDALRRMLIQRMKDVRSSGKWKPWTKPRHVVLEDLRNELRNTMILKICGEIHPDDLMERQTGYWTIHEMKRSRIQQVVVVHNGIVSRVFTDLQWKSTKIKDGKPKKWGYTGVEIEEHKLIGTIVDEWPNRNTRRYSIDLY